MWNPGHLRPGFFMAISKFLQDFLFLRKVIPKK